MATTFDQDARTADAPPPQLDASQYTLFINADLTRNDFACEVIQRVALNQLQDRVAIRQQSDKEMQACAAGSDSHPCAVILEEVIAGSTSVILDFVTREDILAELDSLSTDAGRA